MSKIAAIINLLGYAGFPFFLVWERIWMSIEVSTAFALHLSGAQF
jgi:hypothetical protein